MRDTKSTEIPRYRFKKHASIGASDAESDQRFLAECFVDNGDLEQLLDLESSKRLIVGRTGAGKSALIRQIKEDAENVVALDIEGLSLSYVSNSDIIRFFEDAGVNLDVFYSLLWRHVFTVELLKARFNLTERNSTPLTERLSDIFKRDKRKEQAIKYLKEWGEHFWQETEYRVKEFTQTLEGELTAKAGVDFKALSGHFGETERMSEEVKSEVVNRAQKIVNDVQIKDLGKVIDLLAEDFFHDKQRPFYITIDKLDENWANDRIRYKLIRALLETVRTFQRIPAVKIIVALRKDLLERVFEKTRDLGFQEEKYESLYLSLRWSVPQLKTLVDKRISWLIREQYTQKTVITEDIFPNKVNGSPAFDYMCERTFMRPRDIILFTNACLELCDGRTAVPATIIKEAEAEYSRRRLRSLCDEWHADYPNLLAYSQLLTSRPSTFRFSEVTSDDIDKFLYDTCPELGEQDPLYKLGSEVTDKKRSPNSIPIFLTMVLYRVGLVGVKPDAFNETQWSFKEKASISEGQLKRQANISVHPMFWRALGISGPSRNKSN